MTTSLYWLDSNGVVNRAGTATSIPPGCTQIPAPTSSAMVWDTKTNQWILPAGYNQNMRSSNYPNLYIVMDQIIQYLSTQTNLPSNLQSTISQWNSVNIKYPTS